MAGEGDAGDLRAMAGKNPDWTEDEWIVALAFWQKQAGKIPGKRNPALADLSERLRQLRGSLTGTLPTFRNPDGVAMQLQKIAILDPAYKGSKKFGTAPKVLEKVWSEYQGVSAEETERIARAILAHSEEEVPAVEEKSVGNPEPIHAEYALEGRLLSRLHWARERNQAIITRKKQSVMADKGALACEACAFDFRRIYDRRGEGFIECHHTKPLSEMEPGQKTSLTDLILLCANCHRMVHRQRPWLTPTALKQILAGEPYG